MNNDYNLYKSTYYNNIMDQFYTDIYGFIKNNSRFSTAFSMR